MLGLFGPIDRHGFLEATRAKAALTAGEGTRFIFAFSFASLANSSFKSTCLVNRSSISPIRKPTWLIVAFKFQETGLPKLRRYEHQDIHLATCRLTGHYSYSTQLSNLIRRLWSCCCVLTRVRDSSRPFAMFDRCDSLRGSSEHFGGSQLL